MDEVEELKARVAHLEKENAWLKKKIAELEELLKIRLKRELPSFVKEDTHHRNKIPGQKEGHEGTTRPLPEKIDEEKTLSLDKCPDCGNKVSAPVETRGHIVEDIVPARLIAKKYIITRHYCKHCNRIVEQKPTDVFLNYRFGLNLCILVMVLRMNGTTINKIQDLLSVLFCLNVSSATVQNILYKAKDEFGDEYAKIEDEVRNAKVAFADETGARIMGKNNWLWDFVTKTAALFVFDRHRSKDVPNRVLGENFAGVLSTDCYNAYESMNCRKQKCLAHYLRELKKWEEKFSKKGEYAKFAKKAKRIFKGSITAHKRLKDKRKRLKAKRSFEQKLKRLWSKSYKNPEINRICKSYRKHAGENFTFLEVEGVEPTNNIAERTIRPYVVMRKISGCHRSQRGAEACQTLLSVSQTCRLKGENFAEYAKEYFSERLAGTSEP